MIVVFLVAGIVLMLVVERTSQPELQRCIEYCADRGLRPVTASTWTAGRHVDGTRSATDSNDGFCQCIAASAPHSDKRQK
jgi:hypothetical protein